MTYPNDGNGAVPSGAGHEYPTDEPDHTIRIRGAAHVPAAPGPPGLEPGRVQATPPVTAMQGRPDGAPMAPQSPSVQPSFFPYSPSTPNGGPPQWPPVASYAVTAPPTSAPPTSAPPTSAPPGDGVEPRPVFRAPDPQAPAAAGAPPKAKRKGLFGGSKKKADAPRKGKKAAPPAPPGQPPLPAPESLDLRLAVSTEALSSPSPQFAISRGEVVPAGAAQATGRKPRRSAGAGGRWKRSALLTLITLALTVLVVNGVYRLAGKALYDPPRPPAGSGYPAAAASGYAARFVQSYLTWDEANVQQRAEALSVFFPTAVNPQLGWDGKGVQKVLGQPLAAGVRARDDQNAVISIAAYLDPGGWSCLDVGVYAAPGGGAFAITSYTSYVACPPVAVPKVSAGERPDPDAELRQELMPMLESFFKAYSASSRDLDQVVTPDSGIVGLRGAVSFGEFGQVYVPVAARGANAEERDVDVQVRWRTPSGGMLLQEYRLRVTQTGRRWFVARIEGGVMSSEVVPDKGGMPAAPSASPSPSVSPSNRPSAPPASPSPSGSRGPG